MSSDVLGLLDIQANDVSVCSVFSFDGRGPDGRRLPNEEDTLNACVFCDVLLPGATDDLAS
jgi:hypothetical protein